MPTFWVRSRQFTADLARFGAFPPKSEVTNSNPIRRATGWLVVSWLTSLLAQECSDRLLMLRRGVADRLRLAAERRHLLAAELERLVEDGLAECERDARCLAQLARPGLRLLEQILRAGQAVDQGDLERL